MLRLLISILAITSISYVYASKIKKKDDCKIIVKQEIDFVRFVKKEFEETDKALRYPVAKIKQDDMPPSDYDPMIRKFFK